jgi:ubiquinol-cytochrome c reductase cytochrome b subunit
MHILVSMWHWLDDRTGVGRVVELAKHPVPPDAKWMYVFGSATLFAFLLQVATGIALATMYVPSAGEAYQSLQFITNQAVLGRLIRGMHYWGASAIVVLVGLHALRVFLAGSYKFPRELNWLTGVVLLGLTLGMAFTGQLLRWDQNAVWSVVVGAEQAGRTPWIGKWLGDFIIGGGTIGASTLSRFFTVHVFLLPGLLFGLIGLHLYLVLRHGVSEPPRPGRKVDPSTYRAAYQRSLRDEGVPFWPHAAWRDLAFGLLAVLVVIWLAWTVGPASLDKPPDPALIDAHPRPDWYFWWYFALLALLPHGLEDYVIIMGPLLAGLVLFALPLLSNRGERHPLRRPWAVGIVLLMVGVVGALTAAGKAENWSPRFDAEPLDAPAINVSSGPVYEGVKVFNTRGCLYCHRIEGHGGQRGPDLTWVANRLTREQMILRISNGGYNMPAYAGILSSREMSNLIALLENGRAPGGLSKRPPK